MSLNTNTPIATLMTYFQAILTNAHLMAINGVYLIPTASLIHVDTVSRADADTCSVLMQTYGTTYNATTIGTPYGNSAKKYSVIYAGILIEVQYTGFQGP